MILTLINSTYLVFEKICGRKVPSCLCTVRDVHGFSATEIICCHGDFLKEEVYFNKMYGKGKKFTDYLFQNY
jgi:hypothetical protein